MKEYFNGFSTQDLVDMKRNNDERKEKIEMKKEIERLNNIIDTAIGIANERVNYYYHINKKEILEDWENIFDALVERDNQELKGSDKE